MKRVEVVWQTEKLLVLSNFSFCHNFFKSRLLQWRRKASTSWKGVKDACIVLNNWEIFKKKKNLTWLIYLSFQSETNGFADFHLYVCAAFLTHFSKDLLREKDFQVKLTLFFIFWTICHPKLASNVLDM